MQTIIGYILGVALVIGLVLGLYSLFWMGWCWIMPQLWASGPENIIKPGYWLFVVSVMVLSFIGKAVFGGRSSKE